MQNLFRSLERRDDRALLVVGAGHLRILKQMLELTPQMFPVDPITCLTAAFD